MEPGFVTHRGAMKREREKKWDLIRLPGLCLEFVCSGSGRGTAWAWLISPPTRQKHSINF